MPPLPTNGMSYPPSTSGYQPLNLDDHDGDDLEGQPSTSLLSDHSSAVPSSSRVKPRTFTHSPYRSRANDPTDILQCFLADTRPNPAQTKELVLRVRINHVATGWKKTVELPLVNVSTGDGLPFALADDVPALRGLPGGGGSMGWWWKKLPGLAREILGRRPAQATTMALVRSSSVSSSTSIPNLQVWNVSQKKPLYATTEEIQRYNNRQASSLLAPWTSLNESSLPSTSTSSQFNQNATANDQAGDDTVDDQVDRLFSSAGEGSMGDFDLSTIFQRNRRHKSTRLVSVGLQEAIERFADDRHFSKHLVCSEVVWGWDMARLKRDLGKIAAEARSRSLGKGGKGKARADEASRHAQTHGDDDDDDNDQDEVAVDVDVGGLDTGGVLVYHVVWWPIVFFCTNIVGSALLSSRSGLIGITLLTVLSVVAVLMGVIVNTLSIIFIALVLLGWGGMMYLIRTRFDTVHDTIGTAWNLAPRWVRIPHAAPSWDHEKVLTSIANSTRDDPEQEPPRIEQRPGEGWFVQQRGGLDQTHWLESHREQLLHLLER